MIIENSTPIDTLTNTHYHTSQWRPELAVCKAGVVVMNDRVKVTGAAVF